MSYHEVAFPRFPTSNLMLASFLGLGVVDQERFIITPTYATNFDTSYDLTLSMAWMLVDKGAEIETKDNDGRTPLSLAAADCNESVVGILLDRGQPKFRRQ